MNSINTLIKKLISVGDTQVIRNKELLPYPADIDMYANAEDENSLVDILKSSGMVVTLVSRSKLQAKSYVGSEFYIIDILFNNLYFNISETIKSTVS